MSRPSALGARIVLLVGLAAVAAPSARAGDEERFLAPGIDGRPPMSGTVRWGPTPGALGGWGWIELKLENAEPVPRTSLVVLTSSDGHISVLRHVPVPAGGSAELWLPVPGNPGGGTSVSIEAPEHLPCYVQNWRGSSSSQVIVASVAPERSAQRLVDAVRDSVMRAPGAATHVRVTSTAGPARDVAAAEIPDPWTYLSSLALLLIDGTAPGLDAGGPQRSIVQYVGAGGSVLVTHAERLPAGPLRDLARGAKVDPREEGLRTAHHGLGACWVLERPELGGRAFDRFVQAWQRQTSDRSSDWSTWPTIAMGLAPRGFRAEMRIPGLGELPIRLFFLLILAFAILVGPVAYVTLRRRKQLTKMLWFVPTIGLGFAGAILLYGLLSEGLGTKGVVRSLTVLDQRSHEAFGAHSRTLYAGVSPSGFRVSPDTVLDLAPTSQRRDVASERVRVDLDEGGRWTGDVLPSRTPTPIQTVTQGRARERLRFRRGSDGTYEVLAGEGFQPVDVGNALLLHAPDGTWHGLERRGRRLTRLSDADADAWLQRLAGTLSEAVMAPVHYEYDDSYGSLVYVTTSDSGVPGIEPATPRAAGWAKTIVGDLPRGAYLGWMTSAPGFDDLGLEVEWIETRHLVMGLLASEDLDG